MSLYAMIGPDHNVLTYTRSHTVALSLAVNSKTAPMTPPQFYRRPVLIRSDAYGLTGLRVNEWAEVGMPEPYFPTENTPLSELADAELYAVRPLVTNLRYIQRPNRLFPVAIGREA